MSHEVDSVLDALDKGKILSYQAIEKIAEIYRRSGMSDKEARSQAESDVIGS